MSGILTDTTAPTRPVPPDGAPPLPPPGACRSEDGGSPKGRERRPLGWGLSLVAAGTLWLLSLVGVPIHWEVVLPTALVVVGVAVLAWPRNAGSGLIGLGVVLLVFTIVTGVLPGSASVSAGDRTHAVTEPAALDDAYGLGAGTLVLDLGSLEVAGATGVAARVGMGQLVVVVPDDVRLEGRARVGLGEVDVFGEVTGGVVPAVDLGSGDVDGDVLTLDLQVGLGQVEVRR